MSETTIRWTNHTWNPLRGCSIVSPGCTSCYAMGIAARFSQPGQPFEGFARMQSGHPVWTGKVETLPGKLNDPLTLQRKAMRTGERPLVFVNSMSDLFHEHVPFAFIDDVFDVMRRCPLVTFQILTKRPERMQKYTIERLISLGGPGGYETDPLPNVWLGTSVEDQRRADERIPVLLGVPAAVRFLSCEPLLGPLNLRLYLGMDTDHPLDWIIVGGESGPRFRPMDLDWARDIRMQCFTYEVPFFFKQQAGRRSETGQELDGVRYEQMPQRQQEVVI